MSSDPVWQLLATNLSAPNVDGFIAELVEHRTGNAKAMGSIPVEV